MPRVAPTNEMNAVLFESTGAEEMSLFHQLSGGKNGRGWGSGPPRTAPCPESCNATAMRSTTTAERMGILTILGTFRAAFVRWVTAAFTFHAHTSYGRLFPVTNNSSANCRGTPSVVP